MPNSGGSKGTLGSLACESRCAACSRVPMCSRSAIQLTVALVCARSKCQDTCFSLAGNITSAVLRRGGNPCAVLRRACATSRRGPSPFLRVWLEFRAGRVLALFLRSHPPVLTTRSHIVVLGGGSGTERADMPVIARFCGIVIRVLIDRTFGTHLHVFYDDFELIIGLNPLRVIQGDAPSWVREWALDWVGRHPQKLLFSRKIDLNLATPICRQVAGHAAIAD